MINNDDLKEGSLKKDSVVIVPKVTAVDSSMIVAEHKIAVLKDKVFQNVLDTLCAGLGCI